MQIRFSLYTTTNTDSDQKEVNIKFEITIQWFSPMAYYQKMFLKFLSFGLFLHMCSLRMLVSILFY